MRFLYVERGPESEYKQCSDTVLTLKSSSPQQPKMLIRIFRYRKFSPWRNKANICRYIPVAYRETYNIVNIRLKKLLFLFYIIILSNFYRRRQNPFGRALEQRVFFSKFIYFNATYKQLYKYEFKKIIIIHEPIICMLPILKIKIK